MFLRRRPTCLRPRWIGCSRGGPHRSRSSRLPTPGARRPRRPPRALSAGQATSSCPPAARAVADAAAGVASVLIVAEVERAEAERLVGAHRASVSDKDRLAPVVVAGQLAQAVVVASGMEAGDFFATYGRVKPGRVTLSKPGARGCASARPFRLWAICDGSGRAEQRFPYDYEDGRFGAHASKNNRGSSEKKIGSTQQQRMKGFDSRSGRSHNRNLSRTWQSIWLTLWRLPGSMGPARSIPHRGDATHDLEKDLRAATRLAGAFQR
jgi:hypothetical protein